MECNIISSQDCFKLLKDKNKSIKIIDIRSKDEYDSLHIENAVNIIPKDLRLHNFSDQDILVFYCSSGVRTNQNIEFFKKLKVKEIFILKDGISSWKKEQFPVTSHKFCISIIRQVQIIVGFMVLLGVILAYLISPYFNVLSGLFGLGLMFAGISGKCALANLLAYLPFNKSQK